MSGVELLQELLRLDTTNPPGNELPAAELLESTLGPAGFKCDIVQSSEGRPSLIARLEGPTDRPALVLLSHTDVVPVEQERWTHDPFGGEIDGGFVWGRGALDMKGIAVMHVEAALSLASSGATPARELIVLAVADEEAGGKQGAQFVLEEHASLVGLDEGRPAPDVLGEGSYGLSGVIDVPVMPVVVGEKFAQWVEARAQGDPGHGSMPPDNMATRNLSRFVDRVAGYGSPRLHPVMREQFAVLARSSGGPKGAVLKALATGPSPAMSRVALAAMKKNPAVAALLADTVSVTTLNAGYKHNVVPAEATASLDCRLLPDTDPDEFMSSLNRIGAKFGVRVEGGTGRPTPVSERAGLFEILASLSAERFPGAAVTPSLTPGITDVRFFRARGANGYGWVPLVISRELLATVHGHDERVPLEDFEGAVDTMTEAVRLACT